MDEFLRRGALPACNSNNINALDHMKILKSGGHIDNVIDFACSEVSDGMELVIVKHSKIYMYTIGSNMFQGLVQSGPL